MFCFMIILQYMQIRTDKDKYPKMCAACKVMNSGQECSVPFALSSFILLTGMKMLLLIGRYFLYCSIPPQSFLKLFPAFKA